eukprot:1269501-Amphidinium_carterae.2
MKVAASASKILAGMFELFWLCYAFIGLAVGSGRHAHNTSSAFSTDSAKHTSSPSFKKTCPHLQ